MVLTHLSRTGSAAIRVKLDLEAALLSCYRGQDAVQDYPRSTKRLMTRLMRILALEPDRFFVRPLIHGYMFDTWSSRKCRDEFLTLNASWPITTDSYLMLVEELDLKDELLSALLTISLEERIRLVDLILNSSTLSSGLMADLFLWTTDLVTSSYHRNNAQPKECDALTDLWRNRIKEQESCWRLFRMALRRILNRLFVRLAWRGPSHVAHWNIGQAAQPISRLPGQGLQSNEAADIIQGFLMDCVRIAIQHPDNSIDFIQRHRCDIERWNSLIPGFSDVLPEQQDAVGPLKKRRIEALPKLTRADRLQTRMREDVALLKNNPDVQHGLQEHISDITSENGHRRAFISVCKTIRRHQDLPEIPPNVIARRAFDVPQCNLSEDDELQQQIAWVESTIQQRLPGWRSCVKLKLQFFAVFEESAINAGFADLICACDLHWELCTVLCRYLRRHRTDPARLSFETFQMGCELLLAVFSKKEQLQCQLRDYLYMKSRLICKNVNDPLFGSWELWRLNIDIQLIATLNQLVATKSSTVPQSTIEALIKISLIAPYQVIAKIVHNAFVNRGQCSILIQLLVNSGQLPWLRTDSKAPTLLVSVIHDILCEPDSEITVYNQDQHRNFVDFVLKATSTENRHGQVVINPTEFLVGCAAPLLARMIGGEKSTFFRSVTGILMKMYGWKSTALLVNGDWFDHQIHLRILLQLLQLRTMESAWTADQIDSRFQVPGSGRQGFEHKGRGGGEHMEDVSGLCERLVSRMSSHIGSMDINMQTGNDVADVISRTLEQSIPLLDLESQLVLVPLLSACRQHLDTDLPLPALPPTISLLCQDHLNTFNYQGSSEFSGKQDLSTALFLVLDVARMCEETMAEITWALGAATIISQTDEEYLGQIFVPVLYRVLSISSRSEGCRLLTKGAPRMILFWSGLPDLSFYWDVVDVQEVMKKPLGPYWDSFTQAGYHRQGTREAKSKFTVLGYQDILLLVLHVSEMLLRFSLEPLPPKGTELVLDAFRLELGYDVMIDQVASLILSSIRSLSIDWVTIPTDLVLYCFMAVSKMSYIAANLHTEKIFSNRLRPHSVFAAKANTAWTRDYTRFMRQTDTDLEQQERIARSKARDELVLTAMNISEEIVRRHDLHYKLNVKDNQGVPKDEQSSKSQGESRDTESRILELDNGYQNKDRLSSSGFGTGRGSDGMDEGTKAWFASIAASTPRVESTDRGEVVINIVVVDSKASDIDSDKEVSNNALSGALKTEASDEAKPGGNEAKEGELPSRPSVPALLMTPQQQDDREEPSTPVPAASDLGLTQATVEKPDVLRLLSPDQVDCLVLALKLLPAQEQQAVRARLFRLLEKDDDNLSV